LASAPTAASKNAYIYSNVSIHSSAIAMRKLLLTILLTLFIAPCFGQMRNTFGATFNFRALHLAGTVRINYLPIENIEITTGIDLNVIGTLGRVVGIKWHFITLDKNEKRNFVNKFVLTTEYDFTSSGKTSNYDEEMNINAIHFIPQNQYLIPKLSWRLFKPHSGTKNFFAGTSITTSIMYKIPVNYQKPTLISNSTTPDLERSVTKYTNGGLNLEVGIGFWFGKSKNKEQHLAQ
jgi:hypothetical protein